MSKDSSGLFSGTSGARSTKSYSASMLKQRINKKIESAIKNTPGGKGKSMIIGAYDTKTGKTSVSFAGPIPKKIHPEVKKLADKIGGVGSHGLTDKNIVGVCAEFQTVNKMLWSGSKLADIKLTKPIRPRTGKEMPFCANCAKMFKDLID